jgi:hypothetical protein
MTPSYIITNEDILVIFDDFSSSSPELWGKGKQFVTSRTPSRSSPRRSPWTDECDSELCLITLETTYGVTVYVKQVRGNHRLDRPILRAEPN